MKKYKLILAFLCLLVFLKIGAYLLCKTLDKSVICHSSSLDQSLSNNFLIANYFLEAEEDESNLGLINHMKLSSIFVEKLWSYHCPIFGINQFPEEISLKQVGIVLPLEVEEAKQLDKLGFYLLVEGDTIILTGNQTPKTEYHSLMDSLDISGTELLIVGKNDNSCLKFKLVKE